MDDVGDLARDEARKHASNKATWTICPGCGKEIGGDNEMDAQYRLLKHIGDRSANEYAYHSEDPNKMVHVTKGYWKQIQAIEKYHARRDRDRRSQGRR